MAHRPSAPADRAEDAVSAGAAAAPSEDRRYVAEARAEAAAEVDSGTAVTDVAGPAPAAAAESPLPAAVRAAPARTADWATRALLAIALVFFIQQAQEVLLPVTIAVVLTLMLAPAVRWLRRFGIGDGYGAAIVVVAVLAFVGAVGTVISGPAITWWERAPENFEKLGAAVDRIRASIPLLARPAPEPPKGAPRGAAKGEPKAEPPDPVKERLATEGISITRALAVQAGWFGVHAAATVVLLYFLLASERWLVARTIQVIPRRRARALVLSAVRAAQRELSYFFGAQLIINIGVGVAVALACWWLGLPGAALWGAATGVLNFIPYLGPLVAGVAIAIAGLMSFDGIGQAMAPMLALVLIHAIEANIVSPLVMSQRLDLSPLAVFISVLFWGWLWGIAGALIAVPVLVTVRITLQRVRSLRVWARYLDRKQEIPSLRSLLRPPQRAPVRRYFRRRGAADPNSPSGAE